MSWKNISPNPKKCRVDSHLSFVYKNWVKMCWNQYQLIMKHNYVKLLISIHLFWSNLNQLFHKRSRAVVHLYFQSKHVLTLSKSHSTRKLHVLSIEWLNLMPPPNRSINLTYCLLMYSARARSFRLYDADCLVRRFRCHLQRKVSRNFFIYFRYETT